MMTMVAMTTTAAIALASNCTKQAHRAAYGAAFQNRYHNNIMLSKIKAFSALYYEVNTIYVPSSYSITKSQT